MSSPVILGKRGRERLKQLQFKSARSKFEDLLPTDTSQEILDGLAKELPLHFWALSLISRGNKVVNGMMEIYKISEEYYEPTTTNTTTTTKMNYNNNNNKTSDKIDEKRNKDGDENFSVRGAMQSIRNFRKQRREQPHLFPKSFLFAESDSE